jgi:hypothetical protein
MFSITAQGSLKIDLSPVPGAPEDRLQISFLLIFETSLRCNISFWCKTIPEPSSVKEDWCRGRQPDRVLYQVIISFEQRGKLKELPFNIEKAS